MLKEFLRVFRGEDPARDLMREFGQMRELATEQVNRASAYFWHGGTPEERQAVYDLDIRVNQLERSIRKRMVAMLSAATPLDQTHFLVLMSIAKDVERVGDYAKNLVEAAELARDGLAEDEHGRALYAIWQTVKQMMPKVALAVQRSDVALAQELNGQGRAAIQQCDSLIERIARSDHGPATAVKLALGTRYYKRICGHMLNVLSSVIMPLHKLDYFDEKALADDFD